MMAAEHRAPSRRPRPARDRSLAWMLRVGDVLHEEGIIDDETRDELGEIARDVWRGGSS